MNIKGVSKGLGTLLTLFTVLIPKRSRQKWKGYILRIKKNKKKQTEMQYLDCKYKIIWSKNKKRSNRKNANPFSKHCRFNSVL